MPIIDIKNIKEEKDLFDKRINKEIDNLKSKREQYNIEYKQILDLNKQIRKSLDRIYLILKSHNINIHSDIYDIEINYLSKIINNNIKELTKKELSIININLKSIKFNKEKIDELHNDVIRIEIFDNQNIEDDTSDELIIDMDLEREKRKNNNKSKKIA